MSHIDEPTRESINQQFTHHPPTRAQAQAYGAVREAGKYLATVILLNTPRSADRTAAIRKVREAVMTANAAIALEWFEEGGTQPVSLTKDPRADAAYEKNREQPFDRR